MNWINRLLNTGYVGTRACIERFVPFWSIERIEQLQRYRVRSIVRHAYETVPFYRDVMKERSLQPEDFQTAADLARLPLLDDLAVRNQSERFASTRYNEQSRLTAYTSGSTSHVQKLIYWNHAALLDRLAYSERDRAVLNKLMGQGWGQRQLYIFPRNSLTLVIRAFWDAATFTPRRVARRHFVAADAPLETIVEQINAIQPQVVFSYGSFADLFFRWLTDRQLTVSMPRVWMYGADMLSAGAREIMEKQYGCVVYSTYQAGETGRIGFECERRQGFHINTDTISVRLINEEGRTVEPGETGEVIISNLHNRAMVLLNYRMGDLGAFADTQCPCGRSLPLLKRFEGRCTEVIQLADGRRFSSISLEMSFKDELKEVIQAQIIQPSAGQICWRLVPSSRTDCKRLRIQMLKKSLVVLGSETRVTVELVGHIPSARNGKFQRVICDSMPTCADESVAER